jgi:hypothetical protein
VKSGQFSRSKTVYRIANEMPNVIAKVPNWRGLAEVVDLAAVGGSIAQERFSGETRSLVSKV